MSASVAEGHLTLVAGNDLAALLDELLQVMAHPTDDPFLQPTVVLPHMGVWRWMEQRLAQQRGVAMHVRFMLPGAWVASLIRAWRPEWAKALPWQRWPMTWSLLEVLQNGGLRDAPASQQEDGFHAASRYGDVFDAYQIWRPEWMKHWHQGRVDSSEMAQQAKLWQALHADVQSKDHAMPDRAWVFEQALAWVRGDEGSAYLASQLPTHFFALGQVDPRVMRLLHEVSRVHHCVWYRWAPSPHDFSRDLSSKKAARSEESPQATEAWAQLLADYGRLGQRALEAETQCFDGRLQYEKAVFSAPTQQGVLGAVQRGLYALETQPLPDVWDDSLCVHECDSIRAEVECLADALSAASQRLPDLNAHEVAILVPELPRYADVLREVLGRGVDGLGKRLDLVGARNDGGEALLSQFLWLLNLPEQRLSIDDVQALMNHEPIQRAFGVDEVCLTQWQTWFEQAQTRWGINQSSRAERGAFASDKQTLTRLCDRLALGWLLGDVDADAAVDDGRKPPSSMAVSDEQNDALASLLAFHQALCSAELQLKQTRHVGDWVRVTQALRAQWLASSPSDDQPSESAALARLDNVLHSIAEEMTPMANEPWLSRASWVALLEERLAPQDTPLAWLRGGINIGTLTPFRRMPFRFVAVLGLAQGVFPRPPIHQPEDLRVRFPQPQDRQARDEDRQTFLDTLLATQDCLHLSYVARSMQGERVSMSPLLAELKRAIRYGFDAEHDEAQQLLAHVWRDADSAKQAVSTRRGWKQRVTVSPLQPPQAMPFALSGQTDRIVDWAAVQSWLTHPQKHLLQQRHEARAAWVSDQRHDTDQTEWDALQKSRLKKQCFGHWQRQGLPAAVRFLRTLQAEHLAARLPTIGEWFEDMQASLTHLDQVMRSLGATWQTQAVQHVVAEDDGSVWRIQGTWQGFVSDQGVVFVSLDEPKSADVLGSFWAAAQVAEQVGEQATFVWLTSSSKEQSRTINTHEWLGASCSDSTWVQAVMRGFAGSEATCWHPEPSWTWLKAMKKNHPLDDWSARGEWLADAKAQADAMHQAQKTYSAAYRRKALSEKPETRLLLGTRLTHQQAVFEAQTMSIVAPVWWTWDKAK